MSTYGIRGSSPFGRPTKWAHELVKEKLEAQWAISDPAKEDGTEASKKNQDHIRFDLGWEKNGGVNKRFEIHCLLHDAPSNPAEATWSGQEREVMVDVHTWARNNTQLLPIELSNMNFEVDRILTQHANNLGQGFGPIRLVGWIPAHDPPKSDNAYWHFRGVHRIKYWTASTI